MLIVIIATSWVTICSVCDLVTRRVPNRLLALGLLAAAFVRAGSLLAGSAHRDAPALVISAAITLSVWMLALIFWLAGWWGAADAKFIMALSLAFPDLRLLLESSA
jgi:Flp pilus assembly protein protease CpaA